MTRSDATNLKLEHATTPILSADDRVIRGWCERRIVRLGHEDRVAAHADRLFELLAPLHKLDADARRTLRRAAWLHDVGRCIADDGHEVHGADMIAEDTTLPIDRAERKMLAYLTRRHRGKVPTDDPLLDDRASRRTTRLLLGMLRAADALDCRKCEPPTLIFEKRRTAVVVHVYATEPNRHLRKLGLGRKKFALLRDTLGIRIEVEVHLAARLAMAA
ncbi:MAG: HD domain-containing protein [Planctomycetota bacterium]